MRPNTKKKYKDPQDTRRKRTMNMFYLVTLLIVFEAIGLMFLLFPRSTVSELEHRKLAEFPELNAESYFSGEFTADVSEWFSDTVPFAETVSPVMASSIPLSPSAVKSSSTSASKSAQTLEHTASTSFSVS